MKALLQIDKSNDSLSHIDLSFCHPNLSNKVTWGVIDDNMGSDHFPILVTIESCINYENFDSGEKKYFWKS